MRLISLASTIGLSSIILASCISTSNANVDDIQVTQLHTWTMDYVGDVQWIPGRNGFVVSFPDSKSSLAVYDVRTYSQMWEGGPDQDIYSASAIALSHDGNFIYNGISFPVGVQKIDLMTGKLIAQGVEDYDNDCYKGEAYDAAISNDGSNLYFLIDNKTNKQEPRAEVISWDLSSMECAGTLLKLDGHARSLEISPNGAVLAIGISEGISSYRITGETDKGHTVIWDIENKSSKCMIPGAPAVFLPDTNQSILIAFDSTEDQENVWKNRLNLWDAQTCQSLREIADLEPSFHYISPLSISEDGSILAVSQRKVKILDIASGILLKEIDYPSNQSTDLDHRNDILSFSPDGKLLLLVTQGTGNKKMAILWGIEK